MASPISSTLSGDFDDSIVWCVRCRRWPDTGGRRSCAVRDRSPGHRGPLPDWSMGKTQFCQRVTHRFRHIGGDTHNIRSQSSDASTNFIQMHKDNNNERNPSARLCPTKKYTLSGGGGWFTAKVLRDFLEYETDYRN